MSGVSHLNLPDELKERIEQTSREREENPSMLIATALDLLFATEALQVGEAQRRLTSRTGKTVSNDQVIAWLETWGLDQEVSPPECD